jgi:hypothetical protein
MNRLTSQFDEVLDLVRAIGHIEQRAALQYRPVVDDILRTDCRDAQHIEQTLSILLDFCGDDDVLMMYRQLCRHYWTIDQAATAFYINSYREIWDSDEVEGPAS